MYGIMILIPNEPFNHSHLGEIKNTLSAADIDVKVITDINDPIIKLHGYTYFPTILLMKNYCVAKVISGKIFPDQVLNILINMGWIKYDSEDDRFLCKTQKTKEEQRNNK